MGKTKFKDFISETDSLKAREDIFYAELERSFKNKENIALVGIMENPRARKYKWVVTGAYDLDTENWEWGSHESNTEAAACAYSFAKKFQMEENLLTRFISLKSIREEDFED